MHIFMSKEVIPFVRNQNRPVVKIMHVIYVVIVIMK